MVAFQLNHCRLFELRPRIDRFTEFSENTESMYYILHSREKSVVCSVHKHDLYRLRINRIPFSLKIIIKRNVCILSKYFHDDSNNNTVRERYVGWNTLSCRHPIGIGYIKRALGQTVYEQRRNSPNDTSERRHVGETYNSYFNLTPTALTLHEMLCSGRTVSAVWVRLFPFYIHVLSALASQY